VSLPGFGEEQNMSQTSRAKNPYIIPPLYPEQKNTTSSRKIDPLE